MPRRCPAPPVPLTSSPETSGPAQAEHTPSDVERTQESLGQEAAGPALPLHAARPPRPTQHTPLTHIRRHTVLISKLRPPPATGCSSGQEQRSTLTRSSCVPPPTFLPKGPLLAPPADLHGSVWRWRLSPASHGPASAASELN